MPVMSYLVYPVRGEIDSLRRSLEEFPECHVQAADNADLLVLVTDTPGKEEEAELTDRLRNLPSLAFLGLVAAFADGDPVSDGAAQAAPPSCELPERPSTN